MYYTMGNDDAYLRFYKEYLVGLAYINGRPFKLPTTLNNLKTKSPGEYKLLKFLVKKLAQNHITEKRTYIKFIEVCSIMYNENTFHLRTFIDDIDKLLHKFKHYDNMFKEEGDLIEKSFSEIEEYCIINEITDKEDLMLGHPPPIVKLWKQKKIDDYTFAFVFDVATIQKQRWAKIYLGKYNSMKQRCMKQFVFDSAHLNTIMDNSLAKFNRLFKGVHNGKEE
jgi:hypothetical protein